MTILKAYAVAQDQLCLSLLGSLMVQETSWLVPVGPQAPAVELTHCRDKPLVLCVCGGDRSLEPLVLSKPVQSRGKSWY